MEGKFHFEEGGNDESELRKNVEIVVLCGNYSVSTA